MRHQHRVPFAQQPQQFIERLPLQAYARDFVLENSVAPGLGQDVELRVQVLVDGGDAGVAKGFVHGVCLPTGRKMNCVKSQGLGASFELNPA